MKTVRFHPDAEAEMIEAAAYYETQQPALGRRFLVSVQDALNRLASNPSLFPIVEHNARRCLVRTFPFGVIFKQDPDTLVVLAVMHLHREPDYWKTR